MLVLFSKWALSRWSGTARSRQFARHSQLPLTYPDVVFDRRRAWRRPCGRCRHVTFVPCVYRSGKRHLAALRTKFELSIHSWDVGATVSGNASVCTKWGLAANKDNRDALHLTQVISVKLELPEVLATIKSEIARDRPALVVIDERGVGLGVVQHLRKAGYRNISWSDATSASIMPGPASKCRPSDSKIDRFGKAIFRIDAGEVLIPMSAPFLEKFLYEVSAFPNIFDDDQVDSMSQLVANLDGAILQARQNKRNFG